MSLYSTAGQLTATRAYHTIPTSGDGSSGANHDETTFGYDSTGRQNKSSDVEAVCMSPTGGVA